MTSETMTRRGNVLLIGALPPPVGGITMHIQRFVAYAAALGREYPVLDIKKRRLFRGETQTASPWALLCAFLGAGIVHLHVSNALKLLIALLCRLLGKKVVYTHHNSIIGNERLFRLLFRLCHFVVFVNAASVPAFVRAARFQGRWAVLPAFIPPAADVLGLPEWLAQELGGYEQVVCSNCYRLSYIEGAEVYGFDLIVDAFHELDRQGAIRNTAFVLLDPSGTYRGLHDFAASARSDRGNRLLYIDKEGISFAGLLQRSAASIRATRTDGDSLSVRESLFLQIPVVASDVALRPAGTQLFRNGSATDLARVLRDVLQGREPVAAESFNCAEALFAIYETLGEKK